MVPNDNIERYGHNQNLQIKKHFKLKIMCLAIPGKIIEVLKGRQAVVDFMGIRKNVALDLLENCSAGDYVIVHAGFAINKLNKKDACETIKNFKQIFKSTG